MLPKQHEMDSVVKQIFEAIERELHLESTLFVLCGDHGMNDAGNHGGSSAGETLPALLFISPKLRALENVRESPVNALDELRYYRVVDQTDITPTLAGLLGLPIPLNNLGVFIPEFLDMWRPGKLFLEAAQVNCDSQNVAKLAGPQRLRLLVQNSKQMLGALKETFSAHNFEVASVSDACHWNSHSSLARAICAWTQAQDLLHQLDVTDVQDEIESALLHFLELSQKIMSGAASNYDLRYLALGICIIGLAVMLTIPTTLKVISGHQYSGIFLTMTTLLYGAMMFASSYVEEEQQFWYWIFTGWTFYLHARSFQHQRSFSVKSGKAIRPLACVISMTEVFILALSHRILRRWNQTGQKFAAEPDIGRNFFPSHQGALWILVGATYVDVCFHMTKHFSPSKIWRFFCTAVVACCFAFKLIFAASESPELLNDSPIGTFAALLGGNSLVLCARIAMGGIALLLITSKLLTKTGGRPHGKPGKSRNMKSPDLLIDLASVEYCGS